jgi:hypothetical protein
MVRPRVPNDLPKGLYENIFADFDFDFDAGRLASFCSYGDNASRRTDKGYLA